MKDALQLAKVRQAKEKVLKKQQREVNKASFWSFVQYSLPTYTLDPYHQLICETLEARFRAWQSKQSSKDLVINLPPRCTKSEIVSILFPVWCQLNDESFKVFTASHSLKLSTDLCVKSRDLIRLEGYFPLKEDNDTKTYYSTTKGGYRQSFSPKSQLTGFGCDLFIYDDIENASESTAEEVYQWYTNVAYNRHNNPESALRIIVQQRVSENDFSSHLTDVDRIVLPLLLSEDATHPYVYLPDGRLSSRFSVPYINKLRTLSESLFQTQYQQSPRPSEGTLINKAELNLGQYPLDKNCVAFIDPATTASATSDETGIVIASLVSGAVRVHKAYGIKLEFPELVKHLEQLSMPLAIENKGSGQPLIATLKRNSRNNVITLNNKNRSKVDRFTAIRSLISTHTYLDQSGTQPLQKQLLSWAGKSTDKDDIVDAFIYAVEHYLVKHSKLTVMPL